VQLTVNGRPVELDAPTTVAELVTARAQDARRVAVARNGAVVPRSAWTSTQLADGDAVEVLAAVAGG
jgi:sulfur carrier protein